jgi:hypothetical protein
MLTIMNGGVRFDFIRPGWGELKGVVLRRQREACALCGRRKSDKVALWRVFPEYEAIAGTPPGRVGVVTAGLCGRCLRQPDAAGRAVRQILRFVAARARAQGLPMPPTPEIPVVDVRVGPD